MNILDDKDLDTAVWAKIKAHYTKKRQSALEKLAGDLNQEETVKMRGRLREINDLLKLEERRREEEQDTEF